jgi:hypothetical protein
MNNITVHFIRSDICILLRNALLSPAQEEKDQAQQKFMLTLAVFKALQRIQMC